MDSSNFLLLSSNLTPIRDIAKSLEEKSQVFMEDETVNDFRTRVMNGDFSNLNEAIKKFNMSEDQLKLIEYQLFEQ